MDRDFEPILDILFKAVRRLGDHRPGIVVHGDCQFGLKQMYGFRRIRGTHGVVVADGHQGDVDGLQPPQQRHVAEQGGIAAVIDGFAVKLDDEAAGVSSRQSCSMERRCDPDKSKIKGVFAAQMHTMGLHSLFRAEAGHFGGGNDGGAGALGNVDRITNVVFMTVRNQNVLAVDLIGLGSGLRIAGQKGIDDQRVVSVLEHKTGMTQKFQFRH